MKRARRIEELVVNLRHPADAAMHNRILGHLLDTWRQRQEQRSAHQRSAPWETLMRKPITKFSLAATAILAAALVVPLLTTSSTPAYALEQTIDATRNMRWFHLKYCRAADDDTLQREAWVERGDDGHVRNVRVNFSGQNVTEVWRQGHLETWNRGNNTLRLLEDEYSTAIMVRFAERYDPKGAIEHLRRMEGEGKVQVEVKPSRGGVRPVVVAATYEPNTFLVDHPSPPVRELYLVDPQSKLLQSVEVYLLQDGVSSPAGVWRYCDYNQPFEPGIFDLESELPPDIKRIDINQATAGLGVERGDLTKEEIALKVVRDFLEALIAEDYDEALRIYVDMDAERKAALRPRLENWHVVRIVAIGTPLPPPPPTAPGALRVPCTVEVQTESQAVEVRRGTLYACPVPGHNDHWCVQRLNF
jgi:hypothetical protein